MSTSSAGWRLAVRLAWIPLVVWAASALVAEAAYRAVGFRVPGTMDGFYEAFGEGNFRPKPHAQAFMNWYSGSFWVRTDGLGLRVGAPPEADREVHQPDVLVLGDSQAFGQGLDYEDSLVGAFAARAGAQGMQVANAAVGGHLLRNQIDLVQSLVQEHGLRPRTVLLCLSPRELGDPEGRLRVFVRNGVTWDQLPGPAALARKWLSGHSAVYMVLRNALRAKNVGDPTAVVLELYRTAPHEQRLRALRADLEELRRALEPARPTIVLAYLPLAAEIHFDALARQGSPEQRAGIAADAPRRLARALAAAEKLELVDLTPILERAAKEGRPLVINGDPHYSRDVGMSGAEALFSSVDWRNLIKRTVAYEH